MLHPKGSKNIFVFFFLSKKWKVIIVLQSIWRDETFLRNRFIGGRLSFHLVMGRLEPDPRISVGKTDNNVVYV